MSNFNFQAFVGQDRQQAATNPIYSQPSYTDRAPAGQMHPVPATSGASRQTVNAIDVVQLVRKVKQGSGRQAHVNTVQQRLRQWCPAFSKETLAELVWYCALGPRLPRPEPEFLKAVVMPGGIWQERAHGCWTQLQITYATAASWGLTYPSTLLHEVARFAQSQESREIISMIVVQNPRTVTVSYSDVYNCQSPVNVAMYFGRSPEIVLQLAPVSIAAIWQTEPTPLQYLSHLANDPALRLPADTTKLFQPYWEQLTLRSDEFAEAEKARRDAEQRQLKRQEARVEHNRIATRVLDRMPEKLSAATSEDEAMKQLDVWLPVLKHLDNLEAVRACSPLCAAYNRGLSSALLTAANAGKHNVIPLLAGVFRLVEWHQLGIWRQLQPAQTQLLEQSIHQGHMPIVQLLVDTNPELLRTCRPPLCLAVQGRQSLQLIKYLLVPCHKQRPPHGIDEQDKGKSALGYALQSGQDEEVVKILIAQSRMDQKQLMKLPQEAAAPDASAPASSRPSSAASSKSSKAASLFPMYPHMFAVELRKPAWLLNMIASAEKSFHHDVSKDPTLKRNQRTSEAEVSRRVANAAAGKKVEWINIQIGAANPPTALFRAVELGEQEAAEALMLHGADPFKICHRGEDETTPLHKAIDLGNLHFVRSFTESFSQSSKAQRASLQADCNGVTPLLWAVQCQQFEMALLLLEAGADPMYTCTTADGYESLPPLTAVMHAIPTGDRALEKAGLKLVKQMLWKVANPAAGPAQAKLSFKLDLEASDQHLVELGPALLRQAVSRGLSHIASYFLDKGADATECLPAEHDPDRTNSTLLLLLQASEEMPSDESKTGTANAQGVTPSQRTAVSQQAARQMLSNLLGSWTKVNTAKAAHPSMLQEDQQQILDWMLEHKDVTILKFAKDKREQRDLVQQTVNAKSLGLLHLLVGEMKLSCSGCHLHGIVAEAPLDLLLTLMKLAGSLNARHPDLKSTLIHKAVEAGRLDVAQKLIDFGVQLNVFDATLNTPLHLAVRLKDEEVRHQMTLMLLASAPTLAREVNNKGQKPIDTIKCKKKQRVWYEAVEQEVKNATQKNNAADRERDASDDSDQSFSDEEAGVTNGLLLTKPDEPMDRRQRRIKQLMEDMPAVLKAAEEVEAAAAAAAKASQTELPSPEKSRAVAEFEGARSDLMTQLPAELPSKDAVHGLQPGVAAPEEVVAPLTEDQLVDSLIGLPWEFIINKDARQEWARMDHPFRLMVIKRLQRIGEGQWEQDNGTQQRLAHIRDLEVYRTLLTKGGRIVFEVAVDYSQTARIWKDMIRLWVITLDHDKYERELNNIPKSHSKSIQARDNMKLRPVRSEAPKSDLKARLPKLYRALEEDGDDDVPRGRPFVDVELREHFPAASSSQDTYTLLKFYNLSKDLVKTVLRDMGEVEVDFPFRVSPSEQAIIENDPYPPCSIVLVGRSGTGKTTCAVFRMWARWLTFRHHSAESFHQIFLTANPKLRSEVAKQFHKLRAAILRNPEESKRLEDLSNQDYTSLADIPSDAFPLFWTTKQYLRAVDATLPPTPLTDGPFFPRLEGGELEFAEHAHNEDMGGIESLVDLDAGFADDEEYDEDDEDLADGDRLVADGDLLKEKKGLLGPKKEADYDYFVSDIWPRISTKEEKQSMTAPLVWQEICSFLKGSSEALESPAGKLTLEAYLEVGRKRAPNFTAESRQQVYPIFERYEREKLRLNRYDHLDLLFHIFRSLKLSGYQGVPIHNITRDEVQDFTQAELLVDLRVMCDPNGLFCCGDPCQTIARGIVFRFADICTLFHHESQRRKDAGGVAAATLVGVPKRPLHLPTNYRTHSGILNAAAAVVDILKQYFPMHIDNLPREKAFFKGPAPLLLSSLSPDDLTFLLLGSDPKTSQVEFGAHQVILGRSAESLKDLPPHLRESNVLQMTVAQSKGLEFDDVFLWDFFNGSQAEWRPLNNYVAHLQEVQETHGHKKLPAGTPLAQVEVDPSDKGALRLAREACPDVLLCEELKHLYTALTRAKNNVVIFDSNTAKRAPFFNYLRRLGMAQYVSRSVMEDHTDDSRYVLTQGKNSSEDWIARGQNFMDSRLYDLAAHCYKVAQDPVRFTVATAYASVMLVKSKQAVLSQAQIRQEHFRIGHELLTAAGWTNTPTSTVSLAERKTWFSNAARMFYNSPEGVTFAARLYKELGNHRMAVSACLRGNDFVGAAESCEEEARRLTGEAAQARLQDAIKHYKKAKQHLLGFQLLQRHPELAKNMTSEKVDELAEIAMTAHHQQGEHDKALEAACLIRSVSRRAAKLQFHGYWKELADLTQDNSKAARLLAEHGQMTAAVRRLMQPLNQAAKAGQPVNPTWADKETLSLLYTYCTSLNSDWALQQIGAIVDSFEGQDPFDGDGYMAKGKCMQMQADCSRSDVLQQFLMAMAQYRGRRELSRCRCIAALAACLDLVPQEDLDFPWPPVAAKKVPGWKMGPVAEPVVQENYLSWTTDCSKLAQAMMEALTSKRAVAQRHKEALQDMEEYFGVKGLLTNAAVVTYKRHNARVHQAMQTAAAVQSADKAKSTNRDPSKSTKPIPARGSATNSSTKSGSSFGVEAERSVAVRAIAAELLQMLLPALLKMSNTAVSRSLQDDQTRGSRSLVMTCDSALDKVNHVGQAMKLLDLFGKITEAVQQLRLSMAESMTSVIHQLRLQLLANAVQLLVPLAPVSDITASLVAPFRKVALGAGLRCNPGVGLSLTDLASDMLLTQAVSERSQNQNAGFSGWFVLAVALQNTLQFRRVLLKGNPELLSKLPKAGLLRIKKTPQADIQLLKSGCEEFAGNRPEEACQALLFYMERCRVLDGKPGRQPGHALAPEAHLLLAETVGAAAALGLGTHTFLPDLYIDNLEHSPLLGQAGSRDRTNQEGKRVAALKSLWLAKVTASNTLSLVTRVLRLLYNLMDTIIGNQNAFQQRTQLVNSLLPAVPPDPPLPLGVAQEAAREGAAARVAILAVTIITALNVHSQADKDTKIKPLLSAAWRVLHLAEDCISNAGVREALKGCRQASKIGDLLTALLTLTYRLNSALTQVSKEKQLPFDRLPVPAPGLKSSDPNTRHLLSLANALCTPYTAEHLKSLGADVRQMLLMPVESEVATFSGSADTGARTAAAALVIQEAYRMYRHRQLVKAKMRWLRTSRLWRNIFQKWTARAREQLALRREAAAVVAMEERRKRYQADAQQRLAWVDEGLAQRIVEDSTCPVCCADAGKKAAAKAAAEKRATDGDNSEEEEEDDGDQPGGANPFAALADLKGAVHAAPFIPHKLKDYHQEALAAFQAYKQFYTEQAVPLLAEQKEVESAMQQVEARAALDAEVLNKLHGQRFKLEESLKKLQECMNLLEKEHAWQDHVDELSLPMQQHQAVVQDTKDWLKGDDRKSSVDPAEDGPATPEKPGGVPWGEAKADASWNSPEKEQPELLDDYGYDNVFDDESFDDWAVVGSKKKKKGKQVARAGNVPRGRGAQRI